MDLPASNFISVITRGESSTYRSSGLSVGHSVLTAVTGPRQHYLGSALVDQKINEVPVARELFQKLDLDGRKVSLDALHTQDQTARELVLEHGADYLLTVKDNQPTPRAYIEKPVTAPPADFSPPADDPDAGGPA